MAQRLSASDAVGSTDAYNAWGSRTTTGGSDVFTYGAQWGYYTDGETSLVLCGHRYYDPAQGRWLTRDPIGYAGGVDLYAYCENGPVTWVDAVGYWGSGIAFAGGGAGGVVVGGAASASAGGGVFWGGPGGTSAGSYGAAGYFGGGPAWSTGFPSVPGCTDFAVGASGGVGVGGFLTNANDVSGLSGPFMTHSLNTPIGTVEWATSGSTWLLSITGSPYGAGWSVTSFPTYTWTS